MADARERRYESPRRQEQARETRRRLLDAAYRLFLAQGYATTTIPAIADAAGVAVPTVYWTFGSKRALLMELASRRFVGEDEPIPLTQQPWWRELLAESDPVRQLEHLAALDRRLQERMVGVFEIVQGAAAADPEIASVLKEANERRYQDMTQLARALAGKGALRAGVTEEDAADLLWTMSAPNWYRMLVVERGWTAEQYEAWYVSSLASFLLSGDALRR